MKPALLTIFALTAFAFNSILCRLALGGDEIDASSFTAIRLAAGAGTLSIIFFVSCWNKTEESGFGNWTSSLFLFIYAICFSFAYVGLTAATGALILFGMVQLTMIVMTIVRGQKPSRLEWIGLVLALAGLVYLVFPGLESPPLTSSILMASAGIAWGFYTLRGKTTANPIADTAGNFVRTIPFVIAGSLPFLYQFKLSSRGVLLAVLSGAIASGIGYAVWYSALKYHSATRAAILQLSVPLIAAAGGVLIVAESISFRLPVAAVFILGGIFVTIISKE